MAVRLKPDGTWEFDSPKEALEFRRLETQGKPVSKPEALTAEPGRKPHAQRARTANHERETKAFRLLAAAGTKGVSSYEMVTPLGLPGARSVSGVIQGMNRYLRQVANGAPLDKIMWRTGRPGNKRFFVDVAKLRELKIVA